MGFPKLWCIRYIIAKVSLQGKGKKKTTNSKKNARLRFLKKHCQRRLIYFFFIFFSIQPDTTIACSFLCSYITIIRQLMVVGHLYEVWATPPKSWLNARLIEGEWRIIDEAWRKNRKIRKFVPIFPYFILSLHHFTLIMASCVCHQLLWLPAPCPFLRYFSGIPNPHAYFGQ